MTASPTASIRFLADSMVGKLARWLRLLGHDVRYERCLEDGELVAAAVEEGRVVLTRDRKLVERRACRRYVLLQSDEPQEQLLELIRAVDLPLDEALWMQRCLECNGLLEKVNRAAVRGEVPPYVYAHHERFARCKECGHTYWRGTHVKGMLARIQETVAAANASTGEPTPTREPEPPQDPATSEAQPARRRSTRLAGLVCLLLVALGVAGASAALGISSDGVPKADGKRSDSKPPVVLDLQEDRFAEALASLLMELRRQGIQDERVLEALARVPRHQFVPEEAHDYAYSNRPLPIGHGQTISQPYIVALMSELLQVGEGEKVLEIGTGSGYQAAVLAELGCDVYSIEILEPLAAMAARNLGRIQQDAVHTRVGDGYLGWPEEAPFDRVIVTAAPESIPERLVDQLDIGGRMVIPVGPRYGNQVLMLLVKEEDGEVHVRRIIPVRFVPMVHER
jgi:protein-L-isoaspartate(D-aspartate) O-methyltransferase